MTEAVVEVGPGIVRGPNSVDAHWVAAALECIDDDVALIDDEPVAVDDVWREVMRAVVGDPVDTIVVVCPAWWPSPRIDRVGAAARAVATAVVTLDRTRVLTEMTTHAVIVELTPEFVIVTRDAVTSYLPHGEQTAVVAAVGAAPAALVDVPAGLAAVRPLAVAIAESLRANGTVVSFADDVLTTATAMRAPAPPNPIARRIPRTPVLAGLVAATVLCGGFAVRGGAPAGDGEAAGFLVEGRVGVSVPANWTLERITSGPGSARLQMVSPTDTELALHITQAVGAQGGLVSTADALRAALAGEPDGVFVDFNPADRVAGRDAVSYREIRDGRHIAWAVVVDGDVRIAIGCQSAPGGDAVIREVCDRAVRSAHALR